MKQSRAESQKLSRMTYEQLPHYFLAVRCVVPRPCVLIPQGIMNVFLSRGRVICTTPNKTVEK